MSSPTWLRDVERELEAHEYMSGVDRSKVRIGLTAEIFTPSELVLEMCAYLGPAAFGPGKLVLDPACGDGQFLVAAKAMKVHAHGMSERSAVDELFGVDIMRDNVDLCRKRLGGGTIIMGNTLYPSQALEGQTPRELEQMIELFGQSTARRRRKQPWRSKAGSQLCIGEVLPG